MILWNWVLKYYYWNWEFRILLLSLTAVPLFIHLHDYPSYEFSPPDGSTTLTETGSAEKLEDLDLSSGENASFMVTAYLNYQVPCLN